MEKLAHILRHTRLDLSTLFKQSDPCHCKHECGYDYNAEYVCVYHC